MKTIFFGLLICAFIVCSFGQQCSQDSECGPASVCFNDCPNTYYGLAIDTVRSQVYFDQVCGGTNVTIRRVDAAGGIPETVTLWFTGSLPVYPGIIIGYAGEYMYISQGARAIGPSLLAMDRSTGAFQSVGVYAPGNTGVYFRGSIAFDFAESLTFTCSAPEVGGSLKYAVDRFDGILQPGSGLTRNMLYTFGLGDDCTGVRKQANSSDIYIKTTSSIYTNGSYYLTSTFHRGSSDGAAPLETLFSVNSSASFDITSDKLFYGTGSGIYSANFDGTGVQQISTSRANDLIIFNNQVYWNDGVAIRKANLDGSDAEQINQVVGTCIADPNATEAPTESPTETPTEAPTEAPTSAPSSCSASVTVESRTAAYAQWIRDGVNHQIWDLVFTNTGDAIIDSITVTITPAQETSVDQNDKWSLTHVASDEYTVELHAPIPPPPSWENQFYGAGFVVAGTSSSAPSVSVSAAHCVQ